MKKIYCDISATTPVNEDVINFMGSVHKNTFGNPSSVHKYGQESHIVIEKARIETANAINCRQEEIIFTASGTEANNIALEGLPKAFLCTVPIKFITSSFTGVVALMSQYIFFIFEGNLIII